MATTLPVQTNPNVASSALELTRDLVRIRSSVGSRGAPNVLRAVGDWLETEGLGYRLLHRRAAPIALVTEIDSGRPGPTLCLNACADTAPVGDVSAWTVAPLAGELIDGWLYGRGSADSKAGIAVFSHVMAHWRRVGLPAGRLVACFDADEHTGNFFGIRAFIDDVPDVAAVMIGYPGQDAIHVGARGYWRGSITVFGIGQHSGSRRPPRNAIVKASELVKELGRLARRTKSDEMNPQVTVTGIRGGAGYSVVPDRCVVRVDVRLTPRFDSEWAEEAVMRTVRRVDDRFPYERESALRRRNGWPAYELDISEPVVDALAGAAREVLGHDVSTEVAGPSNVGNLFAARGVPATCGFGVAYNRIHAPDEGFDVSSLDTTIRAYIRAVERFLLSRPV